MDGTLSRLTRRYLALEVDVPEGWDDTDMLDQISRILEDRCGIRVADIVMDPDQEQAAIMMELSAA